MSGRTTDPLITQPTVANPTITQPGTTTYREKTTVAPGASMHGEALPEHSMLRTNLRNVRDNAMLYVEAV
jgi:hypothetical protein